MMTHRRCSDSVIKLFNVMEDRPNEYIPTTGLLLSDSNSHVWFDHRLTVWSSFYRWNTSKINICWCFCFPSFIWNKPRNRILFDWKQNLILISNICLKLCEHSYSFMLLCEDPVIDYSTLVRTSQSFSLKCPYFTGYLSRHHIHTCTHTHKWIN